MLIVACACGTGQTITGVTYNSVAMTALVNNIAADGSRIYSLYYLLAPTTGANTLTVNTSAATSIVVNSYSYYNMAQQTAEASDNTTAVNNDTASITFVPLTNRALVFSMVTDRGTGDPSGTGYANNIIDNGVRTADGGEVTPIGSRTLSAQADNSGFNTQIWIFAFAAAAGGATNRVYKTSAAQTQTVNSFMGFSYEAGTIGTTMPVTVAAINPNLTGLTISDKYYISDTFGVISTSAGTIERKAGVAVSETEILVTNIW